MLFRWFFEKATCSRSKKRSKTGVRFWSRRSGSWDELANGDVEAAAVLNDSERLARSADDLLDDAVAAAVLDEFGGDVIGVDESLDDDVSVAGGLDEPAVIGVALNVGDDDVGVARLEGVGSIVLARDKDLSEIFFAVLKEPDQIRLPDGTLYADRLNDDGAV